MNEQSLVYPKYKYVVLILFVLISICNGLQWTTYMPITEYTCQILNITHMQVYLVGLTYMFLYPVGGFIGTYLLDRKGLRYGVVVGGILTLIGGGIRCLTFLGYAPMIIGQSISAAAQPFLNNPCSKIINEWFEPKYRSFFITIAACATLLGNCIGFIIPPIFVNKTHINVSSLTYLLITEEAITIVIGILLFILFKDSPHARKKNPKMCNCLPYKQCLTNKHYILIAISSSLTVGTFGAFNTVIESVIIPFGFTSKHASVVGFVLTFGGCAESFLLGWISDKTKKYKLLYLLSMGLTLGVFCCLYFILKLQSYSLLLTATVIIGPGLVYITPIAMDYLARITPEVDESVSGGIMQDFVQIITIAETSACDYMRKVYNGKDYVKMCIVFFGIATAVAIILGVFMKPLMIDSSISLKNIKIESKEKKSLTPNKSKPDSRKESDSDNANKGSTHDAIEDQQI